MAKTIYHGELEGSTDAKQMPSVSYRWGYIKAATDNSGNVYVGSSSDVALASTDTNTTTGLPLDADDVMLIDYLPLIAGAHPNLSEHWYITDNAGDEAMYYLVDW